MAREVLTHSYDWVASSGASTLSSFIFSFLIGHNITQVRILGIKASDSGLGNLGLTLSSPLFQPTGHGTGAGPGTVPARMPFFPTVRVRTPLGSAVGPGAAACPTAHRIVHGEGLTRGSEGRGPGAMVRQTWLCYSLTPAASRSLCLLLSYTQIPSRASHPALCSSWRCHARWGGLRTIPHSVQ